MGDQKNIDIHDRMVECILKGLDPAIAVSNDVSTVTVETDFDGVSAPHRCETRITLHQVIIERALEILQHTLEQVHPLPRLIIVCSMTEYKR
jgi:hypothetical protein